MKAIVNKCFFVILFFLLSCPTVKSYAVTNLAFGKSYALSPLPNYPLTALPTDTSSLTDGKYTHGRFWTSKTTVGWQFARNIEIVIDMERESKIGQIVFNTARDVPKGGVYFPEHIYAFVGKDKDHFIFVGDVARDPENTPGPYEVKKFVLDNINTVGRLVLLEIVPKGTTVFCDEIEVLEGNGDTTPQGALTIDGARKSAEQKKTVGEEAVLLRDLIEKLKKNEPNNLGWKRRLNNLAMKEVSEPNDVSLLETDILKIRAEMLRSHFKSGRILLDVVSPWSELSPIYVPSLKNTKKLSLSLAQNSYAYGAFVITNLTTFRESLAVSLSKPLDAKSPLFTMYEIPFIKSRKTTRDIASPLEFAADPLIPMKKKLTLRSGESKLIMLSAYGKAPGKWNGTVKLKMGKHNWRLQLHTDVYPVKVSTELSLNSINWAYLVSDAITGRKSKVMKDLFSHHINTIVVHPWVIPRLNSPHPYDFTKFANYLDYIKKASKIMIFMEYRSWSRFTDLNEAKFMGAEWKNDFRLWYQSMVLAAARAGFSKTQIYLYPFDEMQGAEIDQFIALASWARKEIPDIQFYATLSTPESFKALSFLDIAQIHATLKVPENLSGVNPELWIYDTVGPAQSLSPYSYYRLMSWLAFAQGFKGVGFWDYTDFSGWGESSDGSEINFFENDQYAVIYEGKNARPISSRRWEAWRMGIEDYELLNLYAKQNGETRAKELASKVLDDPGDITSADDIRHRILEDLSTIRMKKTHR